MRVRKTFVFISFFFFLFSCKNNTRIETMLKPWHYPTMPENFNPEWTTEHMNSRPPRLVWNINRDWTFNYKPSPQEISEFTKVNMNDKTWLAISLPHTWQTFETTGDIHPYIKNPSERDNSYWWKGWGYYRKHFFVAKQLKDKKVFVEFDGVQKYSRIYLNGEFIGDHKGGFNSFYFDLTPFIKWGQDNVLAVAVNNYRRDKHRIPPMTAGNWNVYGGIYRDVRLVVKNKCYIPYQGSYKHEGGTFVTTPVVSKEKARVRIKTFIKNEYAETKSCELVTEIRNAEGDVICNLEAEKLVHSGEIYAFDQLCPEINEPQLWSPEHPYLYKIISRVHINGKVEDVFESPLGFRWFSWDNATNHLYVNGQKINIKGVNRHQEYPWLGDAIPKWITLADMQDIKFGLGHNFMRAAHYPNDPYVYDFNDLFGIITVEEVPNIKSIDFDEGVQQQNVREMIRRDRNHPGIFFWSMGNETNDGADSKWAVEEDTTRIIHSRKAEETGNFVTHDHTNLDMENLLRVTIRGWFDSDDAPEKINSSPPNGQHASNETWQYQAAMIRGQSVRGLLRDNCVGWLYEDHGCDREYKNSPLKHINYKGWVDNYRIPKYLYFLTQANYTEEPMVFIHPHFWRKKYSGQKRNITVDSNCDKVELVVNGRTEVEKYPSEETFHSVTFEGIKITEGTITAIGTKGDAQVIHEMTMPGEPAGIILTTKQKEISADRAGLSIITAFIVDRGGHFVFDASNTLTWEVTGPAKLVGPAVYTSDIGKFEDMEGTGYIVVPVSNIIRATREPGKIKVKVSSPGLHSGEIEVKSVSPARNEQIGIIQPVLSDKGRTAVYKDDSFVEKIAFRQVIQPIRENHHLQGKNIEHFKKSIDEFIIARKSDIIDHTYAYELLIDRLARVLVKMDGAMIADDYNFIITQFNTCMTLNEAIDVSNLHIEYAGLLKKYYAEKILLQQSQIDINDEITLIQSIPKNHVPLSLLKPDEIHQAGEVIDDYVTKTYHVYADNWFDAIEHVFPDFKKFDNARKKRAYEYIARMSPYVSFNNITNQFVFDKNVPLIIPSVEFLEKVQAKIK